MMPSNPRRQHGLSLVELMVAMAISLLITLAGIAALTATRQGFNTVDAASQLRDNGRFSSDLIQRLVVQAGYKDTFYANQHPSPTENSTNTPPSVFGFNNALSSDSDPLNVSTARTAGVEGYGSDILILRNQLVQSDADPDRADGSMIDCMGNSLTDAGSTSSTRAERSASILSVKVSKGEVSLMCSTVDSKNTISSAQPIVQGVENFQVLYGTAGVTPNTAPAVSYGLTAGAPAPTSSAAWNDWANNLNPVPDRYLRADQMTVAGDLVSTFANWRRVRSIRIGMIIRGPANSAQSAVEQTLYPFGAGKSSSTGAAGSALSSSSDVGTVFLAPADGRLRQVITFTVNLRNQQLL